MSWTTIAVLLLGIGVAAGLGVLIWLTVRLSAEARERREREREEAAGRDAANASLAEELRRMQAGLAERFDRQERQVDQHRDQTQQALRHQQELQDRRLSDVVGQFNGRLTEVNTQLQTQLAESRKAAGETHKQLLERMEAGSKLFAQVSQQFGQLQEASSRLSDLSTDMTRLQQILAPSLARGQLGEHLLEELLRNVLPAGAYRMQHTFTDGARVDAVIQLAHGMVCVDSKFPLPAFEKFMAAEDPAERKAARKQFVRDCRKHVDDIATKYIRTDEGTLDFALMYIPAENVYYETIITHAELDEQSSIAGYASGKRVICTSPNTLLAYLHVILIGLRGLQIEENARQILGGLGRVHDAFNRFSEDYRLIGKHLDRARSKYDSAQRALDRAQGQVQQVARLGGADATSASQTAEGGGDDGSDAGRSRSGPDAVSLPFGETVH